MKKKKCMLKSSRKIKYKNILMDNFQINDQHITKYVPAVNKNVILLTPVQQTHQFKHVMIMFKKIHGRIKKLCIRKKNLHLQKKCFYKRIYSNKLC